MQRKMKEYFFSFYTAEVQAILFSRVRIFLPFLDPDTRHLTVVPQKKREADFLCFSLVSPLYVLYSVSNMPGNNSPFPDFKFAFYLSV
ncbi:unknown [Prevotella sp. CAG:5226]|nr:unknown [Prevotella sp. CAG:5226]